MTRSSFSNSKKLYIVKSSLYIKNACEVSLHVIKNYNVECSEC